MYIYTRIYSYLPDIEPISSYRQPSIPMKRSSFWGWTSSHTSYFDVNRMGYIFPIMVPLKTHIKISWVPSVKILEPIWIYSDHRKKIETPFSGCQFHEKFPMFGFGTFASTFVVMNHPALNNRRQVLHHHRWWSQSLCPKGRGGANFSSSCGFKAGIWAKPDR